MTSCVRELTFAADKDAMTGIERLLPFFSPPAGGRGWGWASGGAYAHPAAASQQAGKPRCPSRLREGMSKRPLPTPKQTPYFFNPISRSRSCRYSSAVIGVG